MSEVYRVVIIYGDLPHAHLGSNKPIPEQLTSTALLIKEKSQENGCY
jgi:hypothetical protein